MNNSNTQNEHKKAVATAVLEYIPEGAIVGVGTGSTVHYFIENLATLKDKIKGTVASSLETEALLKKFNIPVIDFNTVLELDLYIDSADCYNPYRQLVKGGGAALTREKILATASKTFICIADESKAVRVFGEFPIAVEVIPMARSFVAREIVKLKGRPVYREHVLTDNGNIILDVNDWVISEPIQLEKTLNTLPGVVENGLFANRPADILLVGSKTGIQRL